MLGKLSQAAWETVRELIAAAAGDDVRPGMVATVHTAASDLRWHPHIHALAPRGGWDRAGTWHPVPYVGTRVAEKLFRQKVISFLAAEALLNEERIALLDSWKAGHTGFSAHNSVTVGAEDSAGLERLARYLLRSSLALDRLILEPNRALYRHEAAARRSGEPFDPDELLVRLLMHIPAPRLHVARYYGHYAHVSRARRRQAGAEDDDAYLGAAVPEADGNRHRSSSPSASLSTSSHTNPASFARSK